MAQIDGPHPASAVSSSSARPGGNHGKPPPQHGPSEGKYRLSNAAKLQREHASVLKALKRAMSGQHRTRKYTSYLRGGLDVWLDWDCLCG